MTLEHSDDFPYFELENYTMPASVDLLAAQPVARDALNPEKGEVLATSVRSVLKKAAPVLSSFCHGREAQR